MKQQFLFLLFVLLFTIITNTYCQEPGLPCSVDSYNSLQYVNSNVTLKVILVEFSDIKHRLPAYTASNFTNMLFSSGIYASPNMYSPDNQQVFGSMRDYYYKMSDGNLNLTGYIVNGVVKNIPLWITLDSSKAYYNSCSVDTFLNHINRKANLLNLNIGGLGQYVKLAIIYAGHAYRQSPLGLIPSKWGDKYIMSEQFAPGAPYGSEHPYRTFSHIGIHAHEFGHTLGLPDLYDPSINNGRWDLMASGHFNGPNIDGACPAPINPQLRFEKGWTTFVEINTDQTFEANYYLQDPEIFQIHYSAGSYPYFLIEYRQFNSTMNIGNTTCPDYNSYVPHGTQISGTLVWSRTYDVSHGNILHANGLAWSGGQLGSEGDLFPGSGGVKVLSPWSDPRNPWSQVKWYPNTKPSTNCGMEIINIGSNYHQISFFYVSPVSASPTYPKNVALSASSSNHPLIYWTANGEPDITYYKIYKKVTEEFGWFLLATTTSNSYQDFSETYNFNGDGTHPVWYRVCAYDSQNKESTPSVEIQTTVNGAFLDKSNINNFDLNFEYSLAQNYPNPFNPVTNINYNLKQRGHVSLFVYDVLGKEVANLVNNTQESGEHSISFDAKNLPSGIYIYSLRVNDFTQSKKMILLK